MRSIFLATLVLLLAVPSLALADPPAQTQRQRPVQQATTIIEIRGQRQVPLEFLTSRSPIHYQYGTTSQSFAPQIQRTVRQAPF